MIIITKTCVVAPDTATIGIRDPADIQLDTGIQLCFVWPVRTIPRLDRMRFNRILRVRTKRTTAKHASPAVHSSSTFNYSRPSPSTEHWLMWMCLRVHTVFVCATTWVFKRHDWDSEHFVSASTTKFRGIFSFHTYIIMMIMASATWNMFAFCRANISIPASVVRT